LRAYDLLFEDGRSTIDKLEELISHPGTEDTVRQVALGKLDLLRSRHPNALEKPRRGISTPVNLDEADLDTQFIPGITLGTLYDGLRDLSPSPSRIQFLRQGAIQMMVPPPFMGKTRAQYVQDIMRACPGARDVKGHMVEDQGYFFTISYL
jgi:hypothetical protein